MSENKRCEKCGYNVKHIVNNLYKCNNCGYILVTKNNGDKEDFIPLVDTDLRRFELRWSDGRFDVYTKFYQLDFINFYNYCIQRSNDFYPIKIERFVKRIDQINKQTTDFNRKLPRVFLTRLTGEDEY